MKSAIVSFCNRLSKSHSFENFIIFIILLNSVLIGVQISFNHPIIEFVQASALVIFTVEIFIRLIGSDTYKEYFTDPWNIFDVTLVAIAYIPENVFENHSLLVAFRVLRVFRVLRLLKAFPEIRLILSVLSKSMSALTYNALFFFIFMYLFSIIGVVLFKLPEAQTATQEQLIVLEEYNKIAPNAPTCSIDPYHDILETWFTLFRILTGEDWTDIRYNLIVASDMQLINVNHFIITFYHVTWFSLAAFLLLNLLVGAILNNYTIIMQEQREKEKAAKAKDPNGPGYQKPKAFK